MDRLNAYASVCGEIYELWMEAMDFDYKTTRRLDAEMKIIAHINDVDSLKTVIAMMYGYYRLKEHCRS